MELFNADGMKLRRVHNGYDEVLWYYFWLIICPVGFHLHNATIEPIGHSVLRCLLP